MFKLSKSFWLSWILATVIGFALGFMLGSIALPLLSRIAPTVFLSPDLGSASDGQFALVFLTTSGLLISLSQWIVLRTKIVRAWRWIPATAFGIVLGLPFSYLVVYGVTPILLGDTFVYGHDWIFEFLTSSIAGMIIGVLQWLAVARNVKSSFQWIFVSALSWGVGIPVLAFISRFMIDHMIDFGYFNSSLGGIVSGALVGAISGASVETTLIESTRRSIDPPILAS